MNSNLVTHSEVAALEQNFSYLSADLVGHAQQTLADAHGGLNASWSGEYLDESGNRVNTNTAEVVLGTAPYLRPFFIPSASLPTGP